ncbi:MAG: hypothetical protein HeimC3_07570 [Candidatus Heimdallarchaeota archaeon LC_3]|nr:MAG: hypothetical protein HeimC3_07570 [Candidatus Heimdallarchaeota archaeon LC_3]
MISEVIILRNGLHVFHRSYTSLDIQSLDVTSGLFEAIFQFSSVYAEDMLESINMVESIYHFKANGGFIFILREVRGSNLSGDQIKSYLDQIVNKYHSQYPNAIDWDGTVDYFENFTLTCDEILQTSPIRMGLPFLLKISVKPFLISPVTQIVPITVDNEDTFLAMQFYLNNYFENLSKKNLKKILAQPYLIYLNSIQKLVYIYPFFLNDKNKDFVHFLIFITEEKYWFTFYQLSSLIKNRAKYILPILSEYLVKLDTDPTSEVIKLQKTRMQEYVLNWADLNQYVQSLQANLFEEFFKSRTTGMSLNENDARMRLIIFLNKFDKDIDRLIFALLGQKKILITGYEQNEVQQTVNALVTFYPHPSVVTWTEEPTDVLLVGTHPSLVKEYDTKDILILDLDKSTISGGNKNEFCAELMKETKVLLQDISIQEARRFFQGKVSSIFSILKTILRAYVEEEDEALKNIVKYCPKAVAKLIERMCVGFNPLLAEKIHKAI